MRARLEASEAARREADARACQLASDLEDSTRVFRLHYDTLLDKEKEIEGLRAALSSLSADHPRGAGGSGTGGAVPSQEADTSAISLGFLGASRFESDLDSDLGSEGSL